MAQHFLLVDGYNIIHADAGLVEAAEISLETARLKLCDLLCEFRALSAYRIILVFDAHMVVGGVGSVSPYRNITVVFTKEAETADHYIERAAYVLSNRVDRITVATSDILEQIIIMGSGAGRISAKGLMTEITAAREKMRHKHIESRPVKANPFIDLLDEETARKLDAMRYD